MAGRGDKSDGEIGQLDEAAVAMHEMFLSFRRAGFSRTESVQIIGTMAAAAMNRDTTGSNDDTDAD